MLREYDAYARLPLDVVGAEGCELILRDGRRVLDLYGGHCVNTLGAGDPGLGAVIAEQWRRLSFVTNLLESDARAEFLAAFDALLPAIAGESWHVFCSNSGAEANENAVKLAFEATGRKRVLAFGGGFHGRSAAAAALTDGNHPYPAEPFEVARVPFGDTPAAVAAIDDTIAAVVLEPIQSLAGVVDPPEGFLEALRAACTAHGALLVFDEVQTASGRLGAPLAAHHFGVVPDVFTTAKGAGGGLPIGLTVSRSSACGPGEKGKLGSTFGGGPVVLAAAAEVARRVARPEFLENVRLASLALRKAAMPGGDSDEQRGPVKRLRGAGLLLGFELEPGHSAKALRDALLKRGVLVGTCYDPSVVRLSPPLTLRPADAERLADAMKDIARRGELVSSANKTG